MKKLDEIQKYLRDKNEIYHQIIGSIEKALADGANKILLKDLRLLDSVVDAFANEADWPNCIEKARSFFEGLEDYEACQRCKTLLNRIEKK
jgi:hypothetical protein